MTPAPPRLQLTSRCSRAWDFHQHVVTECLTVLGAGQGAEERVVTQLVRSCREANQPGSVEKSRSGLHGGVGWGRGPGEGCPPEGALNCLLKFEQDFAGDGAASHMQGTPAPPALPVSRGWGPTASFLVSLCFTFPPTKSFHLPTALHAQSHGTSIPQRGTAVLPAPALGRAWGYGGDQAGAGSQPAEQERRWTLNSGLNLSPRVGWEGLAGQGMGFRGERD